MKEGRSEALDVMRGLTLALMIVVNMAIGDGHSYGQLLHAEWDGLTLTDLVFPSFLFVVGGALAHTLTGYEARGAGHVARKVLTRSVVIFLLGVLLYLFPFVRHTPGGQLAFASLDQARVFGVLQRIALCYAAAALVIHVGGRRGAWTAFVASLAGYAWLLATFGDHTLSGNAVVRLDRWLVGEPHLYHGEGIAFDPEGLMSTLPALANVLAGYLAVGYIRARGVSYEAVATLWLVAAVAIVAALGWSTVLPFNKKLWTSSYALLSAGIGTAVFAAIVTVVDLRRVRALVPLAAPFGRNALLIYLLSEIGNDLLLEAPVGDQTLFEWLWSAGFASWAGEKLGALLYSLAYMGCCWLVARALDRRHIYFRA